MRAITRSILPRKFARALTVCQERAAIAGNSNKNLDDDDDDDESAEIYSRPRKTRTSVCASVCVCVYTPRERCCTRVRDVRKV